MCHCNDCLLCIARMAGKKKSVAKRATAMSKLRWKIRGRDDDEVSDDILTILKQFAFLIRDGARNRWFSDDVRQGLIRRIPTRGDVERQYVAAIKKIYEQPGLHLAEKEEKLKSGHVHWVPDDDWLQD